MSCTMSYVSINGPSVIVNFFAAVSAAAVPRRAVAFAGAVLHCVIEIFFHWNAGRNNFSADYAEK